MSIKNTSLTILGLFLLFFAESVGAQAFHIEGKTSQPDDKTVYLLYTDDQGQFNRDSTLVKNGSFSFTGKIKEATMARLAIQDKEGLLGGDPDDFLSFFLEPGEISVRQGNGPLSNSLVSGSVSQVAYQGLHDKKQKVDRRWKVVMDTLSSVNKRSNTQYQELKNWVLVPYFSEMSALDIDFMRTHAQSPVTAYILRFYVAKLDIDTIQQYYDHLGAALQISAYGKEVAREIAGIRKGSPGSLAENFTATDLNGGKLQLSAFKGKYVLLDFWASWCVPCRKSNPHLKELYRQYHNKGLEIIGVADDDHALTKWKAAVAKDGIGIWHNVLRGYDSKLPHGTENPRDINSKFGIHSIPTKILINPEGKIIGRYTGEGTDDQTLLDKALAKAFDVS